MPQENKTAAPAKVGSQQPSTQSISHSVTFRDKAFKSRTIVFPDGSTAPVVGSLVTVSTAKRVEHLTQFGDFERTDPGA